MGFGASPTQSVVNVFLSWFQVGGHTQMLLLDKSTLCKPLIKRELQFYLDMPRDLRPFTPQHKGVIRVHSYSDDDSILSYHPHKHEGIVDSTFFCGSLRPRVSVHSLLTI